MKKTNILYWVCTGLFAFMMFSSSIPDILNSADAVKVIHEDLGYPAYFLPFIGWAKILGVLALFIPGYPRVREWAFAGLMFDLIGALYSMIAIGTPFTNWVFMLLPLLLGALSYYYYSQRKVVSKIGFL